MNRLEKLNQIQKLESDKVVFEKMLKDIENPYSDAVILSVSMTGTIYNQNYDGSGVAVNKKFLKDYIRKEIEELELDIKERLGELK